MNMNFDILKKGGLAALVVFILFAFSGCSTNTPAESNTFQDDSKKVEELVTKMQSNVPLPDLSTSAERINIKRRAETFNDENKVSYIYLVSYGKVMAFYPVKGKISSLNSYLTPQEKLVFGNGKNCNEEDVGTSSPSCYAVAAPDIDGAYGENADGVFFYTTEGAYVEWKGEYLMSDQPLKLSTPVELVREVK